MSKISLKYRGTKITLGNPDTPADAAMTLSMYFVLPALHADELKQLDVEARDEVDRRTIGVREDYRDAARRALLGRLRAEFEVLKIQFEEAIAEKFTALHKAAAAVDAALDLATPANRTDQPREVLPLTAVLRRQVQRGG